MPVDFVSINFLANIDNNPGRIFSASIFKNSKIFKNFFREEHDFQFYNSIMHLSVICRWKLLTTVLLYTVYRLQIFVEIYRRL